MIIELLTHLSVIYRENEHVIQNSVELFKCGKSWGFVIDVLKIARRFHYYVSVEFIYVRQLSELDKT